MLAVEGFLTGDGRLMAVGSTRLDALPLPLPFAAVLGGSQGGHDGAYTVGTIDRMERRPSITEGGAGAGTADIWASGRFSDNLEGVFAAELVANAGKDGRRGYDVSLDLDRVSFEIRLSAEYAEEHIAAFGEMGLPTSPADLGEVNPDGSVTVVSVKPNSEYMYVTDSEVRSATLVRIGAMSSGWIALGPMPVFVEVPAAEPGPEGGTDIAYAGEQAAAETDPTPAVLALAASGAPLQPPSTWFRDPAFSGPTQMTVTEDGRIFGHLALHTSCHTAFRNKCVQPPRSSGGYARFHQGSVLTAEGDTLAVGSLVMGGPHAPMHLGAAEVLRFHADASTRVAMVRAGEDAYGIWLTGSLLPDVTPEQIVRLRSSGWSGHWNAGELSIVLTVNDRGFDVPVEDRVLARGLAASGAPEPAVYISEPWWLTGQTLAAAGAACSCGGAPEEAVVTPEPVEEPPPPPAPEPDPEVVAALGAARALMGAVSA